MRVMISASVVLASLTVTALAADHQPLLVDGGELYVLREPRNGPVDFLNWYTARKFEIVFNSRFHATAKLEGPAPAGIIPSYLSRRARIVWPRTSIAWGVYDGGDGDKFLRDTLIDALNASDDYVWIWSEVQDFRLPEGAEGTGSGAPPGATAGRRKAIADAQAAKKSKSKLLLAGYGDSTPQFVAEHIESINTANSFDGLVLCLAETGKEGGPSFDLCSSDTKYTYADFAKLLAPMKGLNCGRLTDNFAWLYVHKVRDVFDDDQWAQFSRKLADLARAAKEAGLKGLVFDNEPYGPGWMDFAAASHRDIHTRAEYYAKARQRGQQVAKAMLSEFPDIRVISYIMAALSLSNHPWAEHAELWGAFQSGMLEEFVAVPDRHRSHSSAAAADQVGY